MYYEPYENRRERKFRRRRRRRGCLSALLRFLLKLIAMAMVLAMVLGVALYFLPTSLMMIERGGELSLTDGLPSSPYNVLLLGVDAAGAGGQRSDTMIIASIERGSVKLTSLQRDLWVEIPGHGKGKLNAAYAYGGPELTMRVINETFDMNLMRYAVVDFTALVRMVDALGGIEVDISEDEMRHINTNVGYSGYVFGPLGYRYEELTEFGEDTHLSGLQALGYARIRKLDSDFVRTSRQRTVIDEMLNALRKRPLRGIGFVRAAVGGVQTNLSPVELIALGEKAVLAEAMDTLRLPLNGSFDDDGSTLKMTDRQRNIDALYEFLYED